MPLTDELAEYEKAVKAGQQDYRRLRAAGQSGYLATLDTMLPDESLTMQEPVGYVEVPSELIVGTKTAARQYALSGNFLPLLEAESEFGQKWIQLCHAHLSDIGIRDPIECFEYYGKFYVQEGNKRVSVLRWFGAAKIPANVIRIRPSDTESERYALYQQFLDFFRKTKMYEVQFTLPGSYDHLLTLLGMDEPWNDEMRRWFLSSYTRFVRALPGKVDLLNRSPADALLVFLRYHAFSELNTMDPTTLKNEVGKLQEDLRTLSKAEPIALSTAPTQGEKTILSRILPRESKLHLAFVHERDDTVSTWTYAHELGRKHLEEIFDGQLDTRTYFNAVPGETAEQTIEKAIQDGANVVFTTTPPLVGAAMRCAQRHRDVRMLNCSVDMPYPGIRTYYARLYEAKFITGAIAGAMARSSDIGYVAGSPIYGVPANINAFALGARMVNPNVRVRLEWTCERSDYLDAFRERNITIISNRDIPTPQRAFMEYGTYLHTDHGSLIPLGSPVWNWGRLYACIVRSMLTSAWNSDKEEADGRALNYWWGMQSGVIDVLLSDKLPDGIRTLASYLIRQLKDGQLDPFGFRWKAQDGTEFDGKKNPLTISQILHMDKLCDCIDGRIPPYDALLPMARKLVRLQGVYRDTLPLEEGELI